MIETQVPPTEQATGPWGRRFRGALSGLLAAAVSLGVAELLAGLVGPNSSPVLVVGGAFIDATPRPLKEFAIATFGENDKIALVVGTLVIIALFAIALGLASLRDRRIGVAGIAAFGVVGALAALTRPVGGVLDALPSLLGAVVGVLALLRMQEPLGAAGPAAPDTVRAEGHAMDRRRFFIVSGLVAGVAAATGGAGRLIQRRFDVSAARAALQLPTTTDVGAVFPAGADLSVDVPGLTPLITPNGDFYRVDINIAPPQVSPADWSLRVHGMVDNEITLTLDQLIARPDVIQRDITLTCVSNTVGGDLAGAATWLGVPLANILNEAGVQDGADQVLSTAVDGFTIGTPTADCLDIADAMLAFGMNGEPLPAEHGFPVRMIVPGLYGYVSATKWLVDLELMRFADSVPYWVERGWDVEAPIKIASRIDVPAVAGTKAGDLTIAGVAWAQGRGIGGVEVQIDDGDWVPAEMAPKTNVDMWRQWRLPWTGAVGVHTLRSRATTDDGELQTDQVAPSFPNGASGWHTLKVFLT